MWFWYFSVAHLSVLRLIAWLAVLTGEGEKELIFSVLVLKACIKVQSNLWCFEHSCHVEFGFHSQILW